MVWAILCWKILLLGEGMSASWSWYFMCIIKSVLSKWEFYRCLYGGREFLPVAVRNSVNLRNYVSQTWLFLNSKFLFSAVSIDIRRIAYTRIYNYRKRSNDSLFDEDGENWRNGWLNFVEKYAKGPSRGKQKNKQTRQSYKKVDSLWCESI